MRDAAKRLKANRAMEGKNCGWCRSSLMFGEDAAICGECRLLHHGDCWDEKGGCARKTCANAPLDQLAPPADTGDELPPGRMRCPHCGRIMPQSSQFCRSCKKSPTPDGVYRGPKRNAPGAVSSMVYGIVGLFICGIIFGIVAIVTANNAQQRIKNDPRLGGEGYATAGKVLGIIDLVFFVLGIIVSVAMQ